MKRTLGIIAITIFCSGCNMRPSKEARIQKLETEIQQSTEKINQLENRVENLESNNGLLKSKIEEIGNNNVPLEIVNKRMALYNQHNFEDFIKLYANDVKIYTYPNKLLGTGTENISSIFKPKFESKSLQVEIVSQMNNGKHVINHEIVTEGGIETKYISIYKVKDGLITSVRFVRDYE